MMTGKDVVKGAQDFRKYMNKVKQALADQHKTSAQKNFEKRWELVGFQKPSKKIKQHDGTIREFSLGHSYVNREGKRIEIQVPIYKSKHWSSNKYTPEKLREIRSKQTSEAIKGQTHFTDGTPINKNQLVDCWA